MSSVVVVVVLLWNHMSNALTFIKISHKVINDDCILSKFFRCHVYIKGHGTRRKNVLSINLFVAVNAAAVVARLSNPPHI